MERHHLYWLIALEGEKTPGALAKETSTVQNVSAALRYLESCLLVERCGAKRKRWRRTAFGDVAVLASRDEELMERFMAQFRKSA
jgi:hypothetical protein